MPRFKYAVKDNSGRTLGGESDAEDKQALIDNLRKQNLVIISISEAKPAGKFFGAKRVKIYNLVVFSRQLATIVEAGVPLVSALDILKEQAENKYFKTVIADIMDKVESGLSLSAAFKKHPKIFSKLFVSMVVAGEGSGKLVEMLDRLATYLEKTASLRRKVKAALIYPCIVTVMSLAITVILLVKVVPTFQDIFKDFGAQLPLPTVILVSVSEFLRRNLLLGLFAAALFYFFLARYAKTESGAVKVDGIKLKLPVFGKLVKKVSMSKFARTLSTLVQSGVPILASLEIVGETSGNKVVRKAILNARNSIREGEEIIGPLSESGVFPPLVTRMISVGERTGELEKMLSKIADFYEDEVDTAISGLTSMIEPLIIAFLGIVIGSIVIAMFLPVFRLTQVIAM